MTKRKRSIKQYPTIDEAVILPTCNRIELYVFKGRAMSTRCRRIIGFAGMGVLMVAAPVWATMDNLKSLKQAYPGKDAKMYSCKICHGGIVGKKDDLNDYGKSLEALKEKGRNPKKLVPEDYQSVESEDSDKDEVSNGDEFKAGTNPGDAKSKPAAGAKTSLLDLIMPSAWADQAAEHAEAPKQTESKAATPAEKAEYVGTETCASCHVKENQEFKRSTHARIAVPGENIKAQGCESCHGPGSLHVAAGGGRGVGGIKNPRKDPSTCFECHTDKKTEFRLPYHHPVLEGKMSCADCHNPHGDDVRPWSATTMKDVNEACFKCHKEQRGPFAWEHEALREGCTTCHKVHGSINDKMLIARDSTLCLRCHTQVAFPTIGASNHGTRLPQGSCYSAGCHTAIHGSNFDDHLRY